MAKGAPGHRYNWVGLGIAMLLLFAACMILLALLSGNALFATDVITTRPAQVVVYHSGERLIYEPGDPEYGQLVDAAYETLYNESGIVEGLGWSDARFTQAREEGIAVELLYTEPVKLPGIRIDIADPTRLFFPLEVFGHSGEVVFRGSQDEYWGLPIRVESLDALRSAVNEIVAQNDAS